MKQLVRRTLLLVTMVALAASASAVRLSAAEPSEYLIKAGYIYNFAKLVEWPSSAVRKGQPVVIGVLGNDAFATVLDGVVAGKKIDDRAFVVKRLKNREFRECGCQILFVDSSESARANEVIQFQSVASVLTIADGTDFAKRGGVIALILEDSRVRFIVNVDAATQAGLTISSRLLTLATIVHTAR
jgi:hypothetical protein